MISVIFTLHAWSAFFYFATFWSLLDDFFYTFVMAPPLVQSLKSLQVIWGFCEAEFIMLRDHAHDLNHTPRHGTAMQRISALEHSSVAPGSCRFRSFCLSSTLLADCAMDMAIWVFSCSAPYLSDPLQASFSLNEQFHGTFFYQVCKIKLWYMKTCSNKTKDKWVTQMAEQLSVKNSRFLIHL